MFCVPCWCWTTFCDYAEKSLSWRDTFQNDLYHKFNGTISTPNLATRLTGWCWLNDKYVQRHFQTRPHLKPNVMRAFSVILSWMMVSLKSVSSSATVSVIFFFNIYTKKTHRRCVFFWTGSFGFFLKSAFCIYPFGAKCLWVQMFATNHWHRCGCFSSAIIIILIPLIFRFSRFFFSIFCGNFWFWFFWFTCCFCLSHLCISMCVLIVKTNVDGCVYSNYLYINIYSIWLSICY